MSAVPLNQPATQEMQRLSSVHASAGEAEGSGMHVIRDAPDREPPLNAPLCEEMPFDKWSNRVYAKLRDAGLIGTILRSGPQRLPGRSATSTTPEQVARVINIIRDSACPELIGAIRWSGSTALEIWAGLYQYSCDRRDTALNEMAGLQQGRAESASNYLTRVWQIGYELQRHDTMDEKRLLRAASRGLRSEYGYLRPCLQ